MKTARNVILDVMPSVLPAATNDVLASVLPIAIRDVVSPVLTAAPEIDSSGSSALFIGAYKCVFLVTKSRSNEFRSYGLCKNVIYLFCIIH
jgi:hypothetical protein